MKRFVLTILICLSIIISGWTQVQQGNVSEKKVNYTLEGMRHGVNYFPEVRFQNVEYETGDELLFDNYHSLDVIYDWLEI